MIINRGRISNKLGSTGRHHRCQECDVENPFSIYLNYEFFGLFWIFLTSWSKTYTYRCNGCGAWWELEGEAATGGVESIFRLLNVLLSAGFQRKSAQKQTT